MPKRRHPSRPRRAGVVALTVTVLALSACATTVDGTLTAHSVPDAHLDVRGGTTSSFDTFAQNALSDITAFWKRSFPTVSGGKAFEPLKGGFYSVDGLAVATSGHATAPATDNGCIKQDNDAIVDNAFYCRTDDSIAWDRAPTHLLGTLADSYGPLLVGLIFAHEYGHAIQNRLRIFDDDPKTILTESQADCAAGAWAASTLKGQDPHFTGVTTAALDKAFEGYLNARDSTPETTEDISHGNGFDRLSAVADGLDRGVTYCYSTGYFASRTFTERPYSDPSDYAAGGNQPLSAVIDTGSSNGSVTDLNRFWVAEAKAGAGDHQFSPVRLALADHPPCAADTVRFGYCPDTNTVYVATDFARQAYYSLPQVEFDKRTGNVTVSQNQPADYALGVLYSIAWGMAVRHQVFDRTLAGKDALLSAVCYAGAYSKDINVPLGQDGHEFTLSPSDLDEALSSMIDQVGRAAAFGSRGTSGLDRVQAFVKGYADGLSSC